MSDHDVGASAPEASPWATLSGELAASGRELRKLIPDVYRGFADLSRAAVNHEGALSVQTKELMALAIAVATRCDGCIASHARAVVRAGVTPEQVAETLAVAIQMQGGPGVTYAAKAFAAYTEFAQNAAAR